MKKLKSKKISFNLSCRGSSENLQESMLEELKKIREAVERKPAQPPRPPKGFREEFMDFLNKYARERLG